MMASSRREYKKKKENLKKRNAMFLALIITSIMVASIFGYTIRDEEFMKYKGIRFSQRDNFWTANILGNELFFYNSPEEFDRVNISEEAISILANSGMFYVIFNPLEKGTELGAIDTASSDLYNALSAIPIFVQRATIVESREYNLPIADCKNATAHIPVLKFQNGNETKAHLEGNCIIAEARDARDILKFRDKVLFTIFYERKNKKR